jgi:hypothetical protein
VGAPTGGSVVSVAVGAVLREGWDGRLPSVVLADRDRDRLARRLADTLAEAAAGSGDPEWEEFLAARPLPGPGARPAEVGAWLGLARWTGGAELVRDEALVPGLGPGPAVLRVAVVRDGGGETALVLADTDERRLRRRVAEIAWGTWAERTGTGGAPPRPGAAPTGLTGFVAAADLPAAPLLASAGHQPAPIGARAGGGRLAPLDAFGNRPHQPPSPPAPSL